jgi:hypothetical protein
VIVRWLIQNGMIAIPKAAAPIHMAQIIDIFDLESTPAGVAAERVGHGTSPDRGPRRDQRQLTRRPRTAGRSVGPDPWAGPRPFPGTDRDRAGEVDVGAVVRGEQRSVVG